MSRHTSKPRNPKMAPVFYRAGFIEAWGRGYEKIKTALDKANLRRPEFTVEPANEVVPVVIKLL